MLSLQTFGAPQLKKHMEKPERAQQTKRAQGARLVQPASERSISSRQQGMILPDLKPVSRPPHTVSTNSPLLQLFIQTLLGFIHMTALHISDREFCSGITLCI